MIQHAPVGLALLSAIPRFAARDFLARLYPLHRRWKRTWGLDWYCWT
jgi:hypothetical protein